VKLTPYLLLSGRAPDRHVLFMKSPLLSHRYSSEVTD
jgi:hypothetical protein